MNSPGLEVSKLVPHLMIYCNFFNQVVSGGTLSSLRRARGVIGVPKGQQVLSVVRSKVVLFMFRKGFLKIFF